MALRGSGGASEATGIAPTGWSPPKTEIAEPRPFITAELTDISSHAQQLQALQNLQVTDPAKFRAVASHISDALSAASKTQPSGESMRLNRLAKVFNPAAPTTDSDEPAATPGQHRFTKRYADQQRSQAGGDVETIIGSALKDAGVIA